MNNYQNEYRTVYNYGKDILAFPRMQSEKNFRQHGKYSVYDHSLNVAVFCVKMAEKHGKNIDMRSLVRGALLHDYFLYDWHIADKSHRFHGITHPNTASRNAQRDFYLNSKEINMIRSHMFPLYFVLPHFRESFILCIADKICAAEETTSVFINQFKK